MYISFEDTMNNPVFFSTYKLALRMLVRSTEILNSHNADSEAIKLIIQALGLLTKQVEKYSNQKVVEDTLKDLHIKLDKDNEASQ